MWCKHIPWVKKNFPTNILMSQLNETFRFFVCKCPLLIQKVCLKKPTVSLVSSDSTNGPADWPRWATRQCFFCLNSQTVLCHSISDIYMLSIFATAGKRRQKHQGPIPGFKILLEGLKAKAWPTNGQKDRKMERWTHPQSPHRGQKRKARCFYCLNSKVPLPSRVYRVKIVYRHLPCSWQSTVSRSSSTNCRTS